MLRVTNTLSASRQIRVFESSQIHDQVEMAAGAFTPGLAHYSYKLARNKFVDLLSSRGLDVTPLKRPEIYATPIARATLFDEGSRPLHLIFKPFEHIRILKTAVNVACLAWEFSETLTEATASHQILPTQDYVRMAQAVQEVWTPSTFAKAVFAKAGISNCEVIPAPIMEPKIKKAPGSKAPNVRLYGLESRSGWFDIAPHSIPVARSLPEIVASVDGAKVFLMVFNPGDRRKNPARAIKAFCALKRRFKNAILVIKFVFDPSLASLSTIIQRDILPHLNDLKIIEPGAIWITDEFLPHKAYQELIACSDFFICTSFCEGQNLPLLESMAAGVVPVSVDHTAMADYIGDRNAIVIPSKETKDRIAMSFAANIIGATWFDCSDHDVFSALSQAMRLTDTEYKSLSLAAIDTVKSTCGEELVWRKVIDRLEVLCQ